MKINEKFNKRKKKIEEKEKTTKKQHNIQEKLL